MLVGLAALTASVLAGCAHRVDPGRVVVKTVVVTPTPSAATSPAVASPSTSPVANVSHTQTKLPGSCYSQLSLGTMVNAVGHPLPGPTAFVVGQADPSIGRVTYLDCKYGISRAQGPTIEVGVSLYRTAAQAARRVAATTRDFTDQGASATPTTVGQGPATLLIGATSKSYGPTLVLASGQRTVAVTLRQGTARPAPLLEKLGALALSQTG